MKTIIDALVSLRPDLHLDVHYDWYMEPEGLRLRKIDPAITIPSLAELTAERDRLQSAEWVALTKSLANEKIIAHLPMWKQNNLQARAIELDRKDRLEGLTTQEENELDAINAEWAWVKAVRAASDAIEVDVLSSAITDEADIATDPRWPAQPGATA